MRRGFGRQAWVLAACLAAAVGWRPPLASAQAPGEAARPAYRSQDPRDLFRALQEFTEAIDRENRTVAGGTVAEALRRAGRPERSVSRPSLTSEQVDALVDRELEAAGVPPARLTTDEEFLRRASLDLLGRLPKPEEMAAFTRDTGPERRSQWIDRALDDPAFGTNWARYWRDVIAYRATNPQIRRFGFDRLETWMAEQINANRPWDEVATELITATGSSQEDGRVLFHLAHADQARVQPVEVAGEVSRIFMGVQIACAQCHDHPTDSWKREQFHEFAAFFAGTFARPNGQPVGQNGFTVRNVEASPRYTMPDLKEPEKSIGIDPKFFLASTSSGEVPAGRLTAEQRRALAASYVTGQDNRWFAVAYVNRVWAALVGEAFYTPVDDLGPEREASHPELLEALAGSFAAGGYDVKWLFRTILGTRAYQRATRATNSETGRAPLASNVAAQLRADQVYDALVQVLGAPPAGALAARRGPGAAGAGRPLLRGGPRAVFGFVFGFDPSTPSDEVMGTIPQALALMNSEGLNRGLAARPGTVLGRLLETHPRDGDAVRTLYQRVLARTPTEKEVAVAIEHVRSVGQRGEAFEDLFWCLINSTEFVSRK